MNLLTQDIRMVKLDVSIEIPFVENTGGRCVPACTAMILKSMLPTQSFNQDYVESLCGFKEGRPTWAAQHLLSLHALGFDVGWIQDEDLNYFTLTPNAYIREQLGSDENLVEFRKKTILN